MEKKKTPNFKTALTDVHHPRYFALNDVLALVTFVSILSIVLETMPELAAWSVWFSVVEWAAVAIFTLEYVWRVWGAENKLRYVFSWLGIIDLISILPTYFGLTNLTFLKSARIVRIMRLLRLLRVSKMRSLKHHIDHDMALSFYSINILFFLSILVAATLFTGTLIYLVEGNRPVFESIPNGMWWSFRIFTSDMTFIRVETAGGQVVYILTRLVGLIVFASLIGIVGGMFRKIFLGAK